MALGPRFVFRCAQCGHELPASVPDLENRLQAQGMLRRERETDPALLLELAASAATSWSCPQCDTAGFAPELAPEEDDWGRPQKRCAACGHLIPRERVDLFPDSDLCAVCQGKVDDGGSPDQHDDYCPRCGTRMIVRSSRRAGLSKYEMVCPSCRR
jgi:predicted RNA-binding Zn-ribbon protein involved in translation (DUF1610 family)